MRTRAIIINVRVYLYIMRTKAIIINVRVYLYIMRTRAIIINVRVYLYIIGRYREGVDSSDWPTWKTRFRCALNKLPDIQELKNYGKLDGPEPFRAYRLLSKHVEQFLPLYIFKNVNI
jgi:hypothetical protein